MAISVGRIMLSFFVISWMIIHFGTKPVSGGSPPIDSRIVSIRVVIMGVLFHVCDRERVVVVELSANIVNIVKVVMR